MNNLFQVPSATILEGNFKSSHGHTFLRKSLLMFRMQLFLFSKENYIISPTGEKPFSCSYCNYSCFRKQSLKSHMLTHIVDKPFSCSKYEENTRNSFLQVLFSPYTSYIFHYSLTGSSQSQV